MANGKRRDAKTIERLEKQKVALGLRAAGLPYRKIAEQLGVTRSAAWNYVKAAIDETKQDVKESAADLIAIELERLDNMLFSLAPALRSGHLGAIDRALRIMERRAKLLGLDAPARQEMTGADGGALEIVIRHASD